MSEEKALTPVDQRTVLFYDDELTAVRVKDGTIYVPIRPICDNLGIALAGQRERINRDPVLSEAVTSVSVTLTQQARAMLCLPLRFIPGWLFGINANRVKPELKDKIIRYQRECYDVLWEAFQEGRLTAAPSFDELLQKDTDAVQAYKMALAVVKLARNQIILEARLDTHEQRLEAIESQLGASHTVTPDQATSISQAVKAVAWELSRRTGRNEYGSVYGELYRRYRIPSYRELPVAKYDDAIKWLGDWFQDLTGDEPF